MSGPFGVNMTIVSGQKHSGEIVIAASTFLSMVFLSIDLVVTDEIIRPEFLTALDIFGNREGLYFRDRPDSLPAKLIKPNNNISTKGDLFWLALDKQGESLAKDIFAANGELPDERVYRSVQKLNLIEQTIVAPPRAPLSLQVWEESRRKHHSLSVEYHKLKPKESLLSYISKHALLTPEENLYYAWCESLYEILIPWQDIIKDIQSDFS